MTIPFLDYANPRGPLSSLLNDGNTKAWFQQGIGITVTGSGVSKWADQSGNGNDLNQGTDAARPAKQTDGSILFDGAAHYLKASAFTLNAPETIYLVMKEISWTDADHILDGNTTNAGAIVQGGVGGSPYIILYAGSDAANNNNLAIGSYGILSAVFNGASSSLTVNSTTATTGNPGVGNLSGLTLAASGGGVGQYANIQVKELIVRAAADSAATRLAIQTALNRIHSVY